jgi:superoxide dismutase, Fe-Mn family
MRELTPEGATATHEGAMNGRRTETGHAPQAPTLRRRDALSATLVLGGAACIGACSKPAAPAKPTHPPNGDVTMPSSSALSASHVPVPLPFAPGALDGLSERLIVSHHENNYGGAVRNLNLIEKELGGIGADTPPAVVAALRERELLFRNSKSLHEAYFANLGGDGRRTGAIEAALAAAYGTSARWEEHFRATSLGLGGGSGWAILAFELDTGALRTVSCASHKEALGTSLPLLVLDMYEHSYHIDYGAAAARYVDAFFANVQWDAVNRRLEGAQRAREALATGGTAG